DTVDVLARREGPLVVRPRVGDLAGEIVPDLREGVDHVAHAAGGAAVDQVLGDEVPAVDAPLDEVAGDAPVRARGHQPLAVHRGGALRHAQGPDECGCDAETLRSDFHLLLRGCSPTRLHGCRGRTTNEDPPQAQSLARLTRPGEGNCYDVIT